MPVSTCVFDAYGTLFDVTAAARDAAPGRAANFIAVFSPFCITDECLKMRKELSIHCHFSWKNDIIFFLFHYG